MTETAAPPPTTSKGPSLKEWIFRGPAVVGLGYFFFKAAFQFLLTHKLLFLLIAISESLSVLLALVSRTPKLRSTSLPALAATFAATYYYLFISLEDAPALVPAQIGEGIQIVGILLVLYSKFWLGRSFGLLPANRGVVVGGPYRIIRHPMYLGHFLGHVGFLLGLFSWRNLALLAGLNSLQIARMVLEEKTLLSDAEYMSYIQKVRWRLVPFVF